MSRSYLRFNVRTKTKQDQWEIYDKLEKWISSSELLGIHYSCVAKNVYIFIWFKRSLTLTQIG